MSAPNILENAICLSVTFRMPTNRRKVSTDYVKSDADQAMLHLAKNLLDSEELRGVQRVISETGQWLRQKCLPSPFKKGIYLISLNRVEEVNTKLTQVETVDFPEAVNNFFNVYPVRVAEARERLGTGDLGLFDPSEYPEEENLRPAFSMAFQYISMDVPGKLSNISKHFYEQQKEKIAARMETAAVKIEWTLYESMKEVLDHMVARLTPQIGKGGKAKAIPKNSPIVDRMKEFLKDFSENYALVKGASGENGVAEKIETILGKANKILDGVDVERLRGDEALRDEVQKGFSQFKETLDSILVNKPVRAISFEDE
jgi:hypothetical protein